MPQRKKKVDLTTTVRSGRLHPDFKRQQLPHVLKARPHMLNNANGCSRMTLYTMTLMSCRCKAPKSKNNNAIIVGETHRKKPCVEVKATGRRVGDTVAPSESVNNWSGIQAHLVDFDLQLPNQISQIFGVVFQFRNFCDQFRFVNFRLGP